MKAKIRNYRLTLVKLFILPIIFLLGSLQAMAQNYEPNARDLVKLTKWFEGEFDNDWQTWFENRGRWPGKEEEKHGRLHTIHTRIDAKAIGEHVFYVEEYVEGDSTNIIRQRIVSFKSLAPKEQIEMEIYFIKDSDEYKGAYTTPEQLKDFNEENLFGLDGCSVFFKRIGEQYHGSMKDKTCVFGKGKLRRYSVHDMIISENEYWRVDNTYLVKDDSFHIGHPTSAPHRMRRAINYNCTMSFHEKAYYLPSEKDKKYENVSIHSQGGMKWFDNPIDGKTYGVQLRDKEYPFFKEDSDFLMMRFIEKGKKASTALVVAQPKGSRIAFQVGWASCSCQKQE